MKLLVFKKLANKWYIDLPEWSGCVDELEMVSGADLLLESISPVTLETKAIKLYESGEDPEIYGEYNCYTLTKLKEDDCGGTYIANTPGYKGEVWLCNVTKIVLGGFPDRILFTPNFDKKEGIQPDTTKADYLLEIEKFAKKLEGKEIIYKNHILATVAGYQGSWIILGFNDLSGCIKEFSPHIKYVRGFKSYRFARIEDILIKKINYNENSIIKHFREN